MLIAIAMVRTRVNAAIILIGFTLFFPGLIFFIEGLLMVWSSRVGKFMARDQLLDGLQLRGDENVLDVGCGRGLLLIGAAKRLTSGKAAGLDFWSQEDLGTTAKARRLENATIEGVTERVEVWTGI